MLSPCPWSRALFVFILPAYTLSISEVYNQHPGSAQHHPSWAGKCSRTVPRTVPHLPESWPLGVLASILQAPRLLVGAGGGGGVRNQRNDFNIFFVSDLKTELVPVKSSKSI